MIDDGAALDRDAVVRRLARDRPGSPFLRTSAAALIALTASAWMAGDFRVADFASETRFGNARRFASELRPFPLQSREWDWQIASAWAVDVMSTRGWDASLTTLAISIAAIILAGLAALPVAFAASRSVTTAEPYLHDTRVPSWPVRMGWLSLVSVTRVALIFLRAIPEYVWAFMLVVTLGPTLWAAVLALAIHNTGILGKLNAEVMENLEPDTLMALRGLGAKRRQIALVGLLPLVIPRFLLFFFYRWETCVREATVLGMLGIVSLGFFIQDARARQYYDVMLALIVLASVLVLVGDVLSAAAREVIRRSA
jgi:phosphonate transport system permease protein